MLLLIYLTLGAKASYLLLSNVDMMVPRGDTIYRLCIHIYLLDRDRMCNYPDFIAYTLYLSGHLIDEKTAFVGKT